MIGFTTEQPTPKSIHSGVRIGHVHLKVVDLERALGFWFDVLGFELREEGSVSVGGRLASRRV